MATKRTRRSALQLLGAGAVVLGVPEVAAARPGGQRTVRYRLRASSSRHLLGGRLVGTWTYNRRLPGPLLRARVGDRIVVDVRNDLSAPTTIHWHGVEVPADQDGSPISQLPIPPGGSQRYEFTALTSSLFWYHPHIDSNEQVERGLHGALLIRDPLENRMLGVRQSDEHVLVLDDLLLDGEEIAPPFPADPLANAVTHFNGRIGNVLLVNGEERPGVKVRNGRPQRLRLVNVSNSRLMRISFGTDQRVWRVGGDGGLLEAPVPVLPIEMIPGGDQSSVSDPDLSRGVMITPGERADLIWVPVGKRGDEVVLSWHDWPRGDHAASFADDGSIAITDDPTDGLAPPEVLTAFQLQGEPAPGWDAYAPPSRLRTIERIDTGGEPIVLTMGHGPPDAAGEVTFFMQRDADGPKPFPLLTPDDVVTVRPNETRMIEVTNLTMGAHNFHMHGFFFQHIETEFIDLDTPDNNRTVPASILENKDTILIQPRPGAAMRSRTVTRLAIRFSDAGREGQIDASGKEPTETTSGGWLMHCHLLEHSNSGMLSFVQVESS